MAWGVCATLLGVTPRCTVVSVRMAGLELIAVLNAISIRAMDMVLVTRTVAVCAMMATQAVLNVAIALHAIMVQTALFFAMQISHATGGVYATRMASASAMNSTLDQGVEIAKRGGLDPNVMFSVRQVSAVVIMVCAMGEANVCATHIMGVWPAAVVYLFGMARGARRFAMRRHAVAMVLAT